MIKNLILINSANFNFLDVNLQKDLFFLGDNGSGKTTVIRALHYLFSADVRNLGIPSDKDGFKEYYFRYQNSYIIYVFETYFIFMYKSSGEIVKVFSKQLFDLERIVDENGNLYELEDIKRYLKEAPLKKTVKSVGEYRDIVYGHDKRYVDFMFAPIKNSDTFLGLFNEIFNIDKSIIDAKSIKKAIQTTLDYERRVIDFDHEEYLQKIYEFQAGYRFFKEFEKQKETIENAYELKEKLLSMEKELEELRGWISFRAIEEKNEYLRSGLKLEVNDKALSKVKDQIKLKENSLKKWEERYKHIVNTLTLEIQRITLLKEKYSQKALLEQRDKADRYEQTNTALARLQEDFIKLQKGFENELESINKEIQALQHKRDKELVRTFEGKVFFKEQELQSSLGEKIQQQELQFEQQAKKAGYDAGELEREIGEFESALKREKLLVQNLVSEQKKELESLHQRFEHQIKECKKQKEHCEEEIGANKAKSKQLEYDIQDAQRTLLRQTQELKADFDKEIRILEEQEALYASMIQAKPNSFKEFLHEEVDGWEKQLYPILDATLLDKKLDELRPRLIEGAALLGFELNTAGLKQILTKEEAAQRVEALSLQRETIQISYDEALSNIDVKHQKKVEATLEEKKFIVQTIEEFEEKIVTIDKDIQALHAQHDTRLKELKNAHAKKEQEHNGRIGDLSGEITNNRELIENIYKELRLQRRKNAQIIEELKEEFKEELQVQLHIVKKQLQEEQARLTQEILLQEQKKHTISKDERIRELEKAIELKNIELQEALGAQMFLREYEREKSSLENLLVKQNDLQSAHIKNSEFTKRLEEKKERYEYHKEELFEEKKELLEKAKKLKKGLESFEGYEGGFELGDPKESQEYLSVLLKSFDEISSVYARDKIKLQTLLNKLNMLKNMQHEIEISFRFEEYDTYFYISRSPNILLKLEEVVEFKNKKLEMLKQSGHKKFFNFVQNLLPQKMSVFSDSEDKFLSQVQKINKNLSAIDFGVIKDIRLETKTGDKKSVSKMLEELRSVVGNLSSLLGESSLFYDKEEVYRALETLESKFKEIKAELKGSAISLQDTIDLSLSFNENGKTLSQVVQLKNESSTGGSMLLKIAIAIGILQLFIQEEKTPFFLIVDEVSRLHSANQERLRDFANSKGFKIVFVTPEPTYSKPECIKYYRFRKNSDDEFEGIELNL